MKIATTIASLAVALAASGSALAVPIVTVGGTNVANEGQYTSIAGVTTLNFNAGFVLPGNVTLSSLGALVTGNIAGQFATPPGDTSQYLGIRPGFSPVTITIAGGGNYIGFYAGSLDTFNTITFNDSNGLAIVSYTGAQLAGFAGVPATGDQSIGRYFNVFESGNAFASVTLASSSPAFELDNFAIGRALPPGVVPLPGTIALIGAMLLGLGFVRRVN